MRTLAIILQFVVALGLFNVWLLRFGRSTAYRGGDAKTMQQEFAYYGLPKWFMVLIGVLKVGAAFCLIAAIWFPFLAFPTASLICILMIGALAMHLKVKDRFQKSFPALIVLAASACICWLSTP